VAAWLSAQGATTWRRCRGVRPWARHLPKTRKPRSPLVGIVGTSSPQRTLQSRDRTGSSTRLSRIPFRRAIPPPIWAGRRPARQGTRGSPDAALPAGPATVKRYRQRHPAQRHDGWRRRSPVTDAAGLTVDILEERGERERHGREAHAPNGQALLGVHALAGRWPSKTLAFIRTRFARGPGDGVAWPGYCFRIAHLTKIRLLPCFGLLLREASEN